MFLKIKNIGKYGKIGGEIKAPPSKSYSHRAIILASFADGESVIRDVLLSEDTYSSITACESFGAKIKLIENNKSLKILATPAIQNISNDAIDLNNSGTTLRIMTSIAGLSSNKTIFTGDESLKTRPMQILLDAGRDLGLNAKSINDNGKPPIAIEPGFVGGKTVIDGSVSSQFISSLLIAGTISDNGIDLEVKGDFISKSYVAMTLDIMEKFGINFVSDLFTKGHEDCCEANKKCASTFFKIKPQKYISREYTVEGDFSSASYPLSLVAIMGGEIRVNNLFKDSKQGDKLILEILEKMGANITIDDDYIVLKSDGNLNGIDMNLNNSPDLLPTVSVLAAMAKGTTKIYGVHHARFKETDRIAKCAEELKKLNINVREFDDGMEIIGGLNLNKNDVEDNNLDNSPIILNSHNDHRIAMAFSLIGLKREIAIENGDVFDVSFPNFLEIMAEIGFYLELE
ncbi:MAG: 3-phosphoshikimate 1-carboxyvinyltransferase [Methanobrevibacter sp.]|jgi:3-phosphoshikimate 1-carboxyvinyltransferase|nr:3-phosphoshikimate 1-carboxyvinyltransferase [Candidatus Methanoflexus mossambicus]